MKKIYLLLIIGFISFGLSAEDLIQNSKAEYAPLFFSEYIEGSSNNKALEIYNPTADAVDLASYQIAQSSNGGGWAFFHTFPAGASIAAGDVWVIITDATDEALFAAADADEVLGFPSVVHHNGNDARALIYIMDNDTTILDIIGDPDVDPGAGWDVAGVTEATANHTLVRKDGISEGNTDWVASAGTNADDSEWVVFDQNYFDNLGVYGTPPTMAPLFFSEYIEGSSNNKALEIYNPTSEAVDLASYQIAQSSNGGGWAFFHVFPAGASIAAEDVWVIITDATDEALFAAADADEVLGFPSVVHHNGNDARALIYIMDNDTTILDIIGDPDVDPGAGWDVAGVTEATKDHTLVRKDDITQGNTDWVASAGTNADDSEWVVKDQNTFTNLGFFGTPSVSGTLSDLQVDGVTVDGFDPLMYNYTIELDAGVTTVPTVTYTLTDESATDVMIVATDLAGDKAARTTTVDVITPEDTTTYSITFNPLLEVAILGDLRANLEETRKYRLTGEAVLTYQQSFRNKKYIQDATGGVEIDDNGGVITTTYAVGDGITGLEGTVAFYRNNLQFTPTADPGAATSTGNTITPVVATPAQIKADRDMYQGMVVKVENVSIPDADGSAVFENGTSYDIIATGPDTLVMRTEFYSTTLTGTVIPDSANVTGIIINYFETSQISPRLLEDIEELVPYVPSNDATLSALGYNDQSVDGFSPALLSYSVTLEAGTTDIPTITYETTDENAGVAVTDVSDLGGDEAARTATIVVTAEDGVTTKTYTIVFTVAVGISNDLFNEVILYPVPASELLYVDQAEAVESLTVYSITGKAVMQLENNGDALISLELDALENGVYMLKLESKEGSAVTRFVKQ